MVLADYLTFNNIINNNNKVRMSQFRCPAQKSNKKTLITSVNSDSEPKSEAEAIITEAAPQHNNVNQPLE